MSTVSCIYLYFTSCECIDTQIKQFRIHDHGLICLPVAICVLLCNQKVIEFRIYGLTWFVEVCFEPFQSFLWWVLYQEKFPYGATTFSFDIIISNLPQWDIPFCKNTVKKWWRHTESYPCNCFIIYCLQTTMTSSFLQILNTKPKVANWRRILFFNILIQ